MAHVLTPSQTVGPFFKIGLTRREQSELVAPGTPGAVEIRGRVLDGDGAGIPDAVVEIWQAEADGSYRPSWGWGRAGADEEGGFSFHTIKPGSVSGASGQPQAPHLVVLVFARGMLRPLLTRMYFPDEQQANEADPILSGLPSAAAQSTLIAVSEDGVLRFDIRVQGDQQTTFFALP